MDRDNEQKVSQEYNALKLENLICFPLYACARELIKLYKPFLDQIDLTYTQYITMIVLWEKPCLTSKELGQKLFLDSGTLTPLLKKLEAKGYITRHRSSEDERNLIVTITKKGQELSTEAKRVYMGMVSQFKLDEEDTRELYRLLYKMLSRDKELPKDFLEQIEIAAQGYIEKETADKE